MSAGTKNIRLLKKHILETFSDKIVNTEEMDELSTLFNSMDLTENASIDQDNIDLFYSVYAEGHWMDEDIDEEDINDYKQLMGNKEEYDEKDFIKSVIVFKNLMHPTKSNWNKIFNLLDKQRKGYITLGEIKTQLENSKTDWKDITTFLEGDVLNVKVTPEQFLKFLWY